MTSIDANHKFFKANQNGCNECNQGYSGRVGIYEAMPFTDTLKASLISRPNAIEVEALAKQEGMQTLRDSQNYSGKL